LDEDADKFEIHFTQSDCALLQILRQLETHVLKMKRFECLFLSEQQVRAMYQQIAVIPESLTTLVRSVANYNFAVSVNCSFITSSESITQYEVYKLVCKLYQHFCSAQRERKVNVITSRPITILDLTKPKSDATNNVARKPVKRSKKRSNKEGKETRKCAYCEKVKDKNEDFYDKKAECKECCQTMSHYWVSPDKVNLLTEMIQILLYLCNLSGNIRLLSLDEPILARYLECDADPTLSELFGTRGCKTLKDVLSFYENKCDL
jgi:hypothetical protein